mmetsp:Transcript_14348/g.36045  ORF Transcript_14348/g.36045 Transcript_14348/m.36045 type:complete len:84 (-) Transcript_14348:19-270(-)
MYGILPNEILHLAAVVASARDDFTIKKTTSGEGEQQLSDVVRRKRTVEREEKNYETETVVMYVLFPIDCLPHIGFRAGSMILN